MEIVDKYDNKRLPLNKTGIRDENIPGEYGNSVHVWIMNSKGDFLMQKRSPFKKKFPNMYAQTGGAVDAGETPLDAALRECKEELGVDIPKDNIELVLSFKRKFDFVDIFLAKINIDINNIILQEEEVSEVSWIPLNKLKEMIESKETAPSIEFYFDMFYELINI